MIMMTASAALPVTCVQAAQLKDAVRVCMQFHFACCGVAKEHIHNAPGTSCTDVLGRVQGALAAVPVCVY